MKGIDTMRGINFKFNRKGMFICMVIISFLCIYIYNVFTPLMMDDLSYAKAASEAHSFGDLVRQEHEQYINWTGRSVGHFILRCFLKGDKWIFNICNSIVFVALTLFMYYNVQNKKKWDIFVYVLINLLVWLFGVLFSQTVLWETGACNYLWGSTIILGYISLFRHCMKKNISARLQAVYSILLFILGIPAGWCNENTSGGCILILCIWTVFYLKENKKINAYMLFGIVGNLIGFLLMIMAPGNAVRGKYALEAEEHTGLLAIMSRWLKCSLAIQKNFFILIAICILTFVLIRLQKVSWQKSKNMIIFFVCFIAICYALVLTPEPMERAYFGAGIFLIVSCVQGIVDVLDDNIYIISVKLSAILICSLYFAFMYLECGADLVRIYRDSYERFAYIEEQKALGIDDITVPLLHPEFENKYSAAYISDLSADSSGYWINTTFAEYYGINSISAVPRDEWTEY